ncbi:tail fiber domain-containing protein [Carboxylicivirga sp. RSCT41]|uniref:tail fiber domain-containing protein n=1 Tax=Carboxylicivirga agarovorans TaxID=3417570 RepID=UPI003D3410D7
MIYKKKLKTKEFSRNKRIYNSGGSSSSSSIGGSGVGGSFLDQYFTFDTVNDILIANKTIASEGSLVAYLNNGQTLPSIFDDLPKASATDFGVVKVGTGFNVNQGVISLDSSAVTPQTLSLVGNDLSISNGNTVDLSGLSPDLTGYASESWVNTQLTDYVTDSSLNTTLGGYEPIITTKNSAFNKSFSGSGSASTVSRSDHNHNTSYHPLNGNTSTAFSVSQLTLKSGVFTYDAVEDEIVINKNVRIQGNTLSEGSVTAYAANGGSSTIWDGAPIASYSDKGILSVNNTSPLTITNGVLSLNSTAIDPTLTLNGNTLNVNGSSIDLSSISTDLTDYYTKSESDNRYSLQGGSSTTDFKVRNLNVYGELSFINAVDIPIDDAFVKLNNGNALVDSGIKVYNGTDDKARLFFQASTGKWVFGDDDVYNKIASEEWVSANYLLSTGKAVDSDKLDGINGSQFLRSDVDDIKWGKTWFNNNITGQDASGAIAQFNGFIRTGNIYLHTGGNSPNNDRDGDVISNNNGQLEWRSNKVWHSGNVGSGSGLDADTLDTYHASSFPRKSENATITSTWKFSNGLKISDSVTTSQGKGIRWHGTSDGYGIYQTTGAWSNPYNQLRLQWNTGIIIYGGDDAYLKSGVMIPSNVSIGKEEKPTVPLDVNGKGRFAGQDSGKQIQIGGLTGDRSTSMGVVTVTNGNLHIDAATGFNSYINYYNRYPTYIGGNTYIGADTDSDSRVLKITSKADAGIQLIADTDNATETHNPYIYFAQDGAGVKGNIGYNDTGLDSMQNTVSNATTNSMILHNQSSTNIEFAINGTRRMYLSNSGTLDVTGLIQGSYFKADGTAGFSCESGNGRGYRFWNSDSYKIYMAQDADATWGGALVDDTDYHTYFRMSGTKRGWVFRNLSTTSTNNGAVLQISGEGNLTARGTIKAYATSDRRLKEDIKPLSNSLDVVNKLNPVSYKWNEKGVDLMSLSDDKVDDIGLIAQELEDVVPEAIGTLYDDYKAIEYSKLIPHLIKAIQELSNEVNELKKK